MGKRQVRFVSKAEAGQGWRIWDRTQKKWWGNPYQAYPERLLAELNGETVVNLTFAGARTSFGSLDDGLWKLLVVHSRVHRTDDHATILTTDHVDRFRGWVGVGHCFQSLPAAAESLEEGLGECFLSPRPRREPP